MLIESFIEAVGDTRLQFRRNIYELSSFASAVIGMMWFTSNLDPIMRPVVNEDQSPEEQACIVSFARIIDAMPKSNSSSFIQENLVDVLVAINSSLSCKKVESDEDYIPAHDGLPI